MRIAYWSTACLEPRHEAVSKEVLELSQRMPGSWVFAIHPNIGARASLRGRYVGLSSAVTPVLRAAIPLLERAFDINHIYGNMTPWAFHKSLHRRPIIHTVTQDSESPVMELLERCEAVILQSEATRDRLRSLGMPPARLHLRYPAIDLGRFQPAPRQRAPSGAPRILFSTSPRTTEEMEGRGVFLLLDAARRLAQVEFRLLYRAWAASYTSLAPTREAIAARELGNVTLVAGSVDDMAAEYHRADFTLIPFLHPAGGKECPNSAVESLASGVPVLISSACPFSRFVAEHRCGVVFDPVPEALGEAVAEGWSRWTELSAAARVAAEAHFDSSELAAYHARLYQACGAVGRARRRMPANA